MNKFKIGDICIICNIIHEPNTKYNGEEVTITSLPGSSIDFPRDYGVDGNIDITECSPYCGEHNLKLKRSNGPEDSYKVVEWDDVGWKPNTVKECV